MKDLLKELEQLPKGGITYKTINGKQYAYYQWREDGKQRSRRVQDDELGELQALIARRKELEEQRKGEVVAPSRKDAEAIIQEQLPLRTLIGKRLRQYAEPVKAWEKRDCFHQLEQYLYGAHTDKVLILYGLRRTGKTTLIRQLIGEMTEEALGRTAFIQVRSTDTLGKLYDELDLLAESGFQYVFIDEVTFLEDFIEGGATLADIYAAGGMRVVLSGTDSLGFLFSEDEQLYDRAILLHTTFIPYREFERVLGIKGVDEYIRHGGTMSLSGVDYNGAGTFENAQTAGAYVDTAIAHNIQHSLRNYQEEGHFRSLKGLFDEGELTSAINRVVEDINHEFTLKVLTRDFKSHDLGLSRRNLAKDRQTPNHVLEQIDLSKVTRQLREELNILNKDEMSIELEEVHRAQIKDYLDRLDLTVDIDVVQFGKKGFEGTSTMTAISQPGLRYAQAKVLIETLLKDEAFTNLSLAERNEVCARILEEVRGRMLEELVLLETKMARPTCEVFQLQFPIGEFDMVVFDPESASCELFEIKHSESRTPEQYRHLTDGEKCEMTAFRYGVITGKHVLYRGPSTVSETEGVDYWNVEDYLNQLG